MSGDSTEVHFFTAAGVDDFRLPRDKGGYAFHPCPAHRVALAPAGPPVRGFSPESRAVARIRTLEEYVERFQCDGVALTKVVMPAAEAQRGLADLAMMGLTPARLFPDIIGAAQAAEMRVLLDRGDD